MARLSAAKLEVSEEQQAELEAIVRLSAASSESDRIRRQEELRGPLYPIASARGVHRADLLPG